MRGALTVAGGALGLSWVMSVRRVMGTEVEYGISVPGQPTANPTTLSSQVVNAWSVAEAPSPRRARWDFEEESPLRDAQLRPLAAQALDHNDLDEDTGMANVILTNSARLYVDHAHPEYSTPESPTRATSSCGTRRGSW